MSTQVLEDASYRHIISYYHIIFFHLPFYDKAVLRYSTAGS